jgi:hypothetical protein
VVLFVLYVMLVMLFTTKLHHVSRLTIMTHNVATTYSILSYSAKVAMLDTTILIITVVPCHSLKRPRLVV